MALREEPVAPRIGGLHRRTMLQAAGFTLAIAATLAVFLTENPQILRLAVVGVAWAFVLATFAAGRRSADRVAARARENALRRAYDVELEREVAARREYELELEARLRRETEESMRATLDGLRDDVAGLAELRARSPASPNCAPTSPPSPRCGASCRGSPPSGRTSPR
jgi:C4-dicarboxylate-specific signal transduction histidine kinase